MHVMRRMGHFVAALLLGLAGLTAVAVLAASATLRRWSEQDTRLRAQLAVSGARQALIADWATAPERVELILREITRDERILAAAACDRTLARIARAGPYAEVADCLASAPEIQAALAESSQALMSDWSLELPTGRAHVTVSAVVSGNDVIGWVVLLHDLAFLGRREWLAQRFLLIAFGILAASAAVVTILAARISWRGWSAELARLLAGGPERPEFTPLLRDVRELVDRIVREREQDAQLGAWNATRLRQTLARYLHNERVVIVANREPYIHGRSQDGRVYVQHPASGLVTALEPVMRACSGTWIAHGSGTADRETADAGGRLRVPPGEESYTLRRVWLSAEEERGYYYGFANEGLWPLCHLAHARPAFRNEDWRHYCEVNRKFADAVASEVESPDPIVLVQDYHFALAPRLIRERLPRATIISFWHIPWPNFERLGICPWRDELLEGLLGSSIVGFHTQFHCNNFLDGVDRYLESRIDREQQSVVQRGHATLVRPYPISIEWPSQWTESSPPVDACRAAVLAELGLPRDALLGVGIDRLDYTKGIEERLLAVERLLERFPQYRGRFTFAQLAAPSRTVIERYRELNDSVEHLAQRINERFGSGGYRPVILQRVHHEPPDVFRYYRAADLCYVSSLHDGMNLVAKEFVAARDDLRGVLLLSYFTGAARELGEALIVNPYNLDEAADAMATALTMPPGEQRERMQSMRAMVSEFNVYRWAGRMLVDAARLRDRERLTGRLADRVGVG